MTDDNSITEINKAISVYEGTIQINTSTSEDYISYHEKINVKKYDYDKTIAESKNLFDTKTSWEVKKKLLFLLGEFATPECFQILKKYINNPETNHKDWAMLALQELRFHVENELYDEGKDMIISPLGGEGDKTRYFVVVSKKRNQAFTPKEETVLSEKIREIAKRKKSEVEEIEFSRSYMVIKMLVSICTTLQEVIDAFLDIGSTEMNILRYHFFSINTHKPTKNEIQEYLEMDEVKML